MWEQRQPTTAIKFRRQSPISHVSFLVPLLNPDPFGIAGVS